MKYIKPPLDTSTLITLLQSRGLHFGNETVAQQSFLSISYFRLAEYMRPFEEDKNTHHFRPNTSFEDVLYLYHFDEELRSLLFTSFHS